jgi:hypothetical protein
MISRALKGFHLSPASTLLTHGDLDMSIRRRGRQIHVCGNDILEVECDDLKELQSKPERRK